jgi:disulfide bond formation protein DsbB
VVTQIDGISTMSTKKPARNGSGQRSERPPILASLVALVSFVLLAVATVWGAFSTNYRLSEPYRAVLMHEIRVAEAASLDLAALRRGRGEFLKTCTACHGPRGEAKPNLGKDLRASEFLAAKSDSELRMFLKLGRNTWDADNTTGVAMPPKGGNPMLDDDDLADIVQFLRYLQASANY